ncbi:T9SS type A sorting domain-containing protein [Maribacter sp. R77961]|uniref:T9SS type A sorting domain-containing protein n=1 Tax=Maribacter sp. R77961 TaxID=3093871 RepID=UPI0037CB8E21
MKIKLLLITFLLGIIWWGHGQIRLVADINTGQEDSSPRDFTEFNGALFFVSDISGRDVIYSMDTNEVVTPQWTLGQYEFHDLVVYNSSLYIMATNLNTPEDGANLWQYLGPETFSAQFSNLHIFNNFTEESLIVFEGELYFGAELSEEGSFDINNPFYALHKFDGNEITEIITDQEFVDIEEPLHYVVHENELYFIAKETFFDPESSFTSVDNPIFRVNNDETFSFVHNPNLFEENRVQDLISYNGLLWYYGNPNDASIFNNRLYSLNTTNSDLSFDDSFFTFGGLQIFNGDLYFPIKTGLDTTQNLGILDTANNLTVIGGTQINLLDFTASLNNEIFYGGNGSVGFELYSYTLGDLEVKLVQDYKTSGANLNGFPLGEGTAFNNRLYLSARGDNGLGSELSVLDPVLCDNNRDVVLNTQEDVFRFGNCNFSSVNGSLTIFDDSSGTAITDLSPLSSLISISGTLSLNACASLNTLTGLNNLTFVNELIIDTMSGLTSLSGLDGLTDIGTERLLINNNANLASLNGLQNLTAIGPASDDGNVNDALTINLNNSLTDIAALSNLTELRGLQLSQLPVLTSLEGLHNLTEVFGFGIEIRSMDILENLNGIRSLNTVSALTINGLDSLNSLQGLENLTTATNLLRIENNPSLTNVDELSSLFIAPLDVDGNSSLSNFCGLYTLAINSSDAFNITNNLTNPTQQEIIDNGSCAAVFIDFSGTSFSGIESDQTNQDQFGIRVQGDVVDVNTTVTVRFTSGNAIVSPNPNADFSFGTNGEISITIPVGTYDASSFIPLSGFIDDNDPFEIIDDALYEGNENLTLEIANITGAETFLQDNITLQYEIIDDDYVPRIRVVDGTASESGTLDTAEFIFELTDGQGNLVPNDFSQDLFIDYAISGTATEINDYQSLPQVLLTGVNAQSVFIFPEDDTIAELTEDVTITIVRTGVFPFYQLGSTASTASIQILDNEVPGFTLSKTTVTTSEPNLTDSFTVILNVQPAGDVRLNISSSLNPDEFIVNENIIQFSATNWNTPQTIVVTGQDDAVVDGTQNYEFIVALDEENSDDAYDAVPDQTVIGTNSDDDVAGTPNFTLSKNVVITSEPNGSDNFTVTLNTQPTTDVVIDIASNDTGEANVTPTSLTFSNTDWNAPQNVTVTGQDDTIVDGIQDYVLTVSINDDESDDAYDAVPDQTVSGTNADNDVAGTPGFTLSQTTVATAEPSGSDSFTVVLDQQPVTDVVIDIVSNDLGEAIVTPESLTFSNANWNIPQTITVTGQDDTIVDGTQDYVLTLSVNDAESDDAYDAVPDQTVSGTNADDDVAGTPNFTLSKNVVATSEPNGSDNFTVVLNTQPTADVVIDIVSNDTGEANVTPTSLTFSNTNWNAPQSVAVNGQDDTIVDGTQDYVLTLSVNDAESDDAYDAVPDQTVSGTNADNDVANGNPIINQEDIEILLNSATCPGISNGEIQIKTTANYTFQVSLNDKNLPDTVSQSNPLIINDLSKGSYEICLSIIEFPNWEQCFTATIFNFEDLVADLLDVDSIEQFALISLKGSKSYEVNVNEIKYNYTFDNVLTKELKIPLELGVNKITIKGDSDCQGIYSEEVHINTINLFPNPVTTSVTINGLPNENISYRIYDSGGSLVLNDTEQITQRNLSLNLQSLSAGWYFIVIASNTEVFEYKIIKE